MDNGIVKTFADVIRAATSARTAPYDTTATVVRVDGSTAWVRIPGGVPETPVRLTISAKDGDAVQVRVSGGSAWLTGNDSAPPTDNAAADQVRADLEEAKNAIFRALEVISLQTRRLKIVDADGNVLAEFDADERLAEIAGWSAESGVLATVVDDPDIPTVQRRIALNAQSGEIIVQKIEKGSGLIEGDLIITKDKISFGVYNGGVLWYRNEVYMAADGQRGSFVFDSGAPYGGQLAVENYDHNGGTLYTGDKDISAVGDGTVTGAISHVAGAVSIFQITGSDLSLTSGASTAVASITLKKGKYILTGVSRFAANVDGHRTILFSRTAGSVSSYDNFALERLGASQSSVTYIQLTWPVEITADGTTIYLNAIQNSGAALNVDRTGIKAVALDGGGIYAAG